jgi:DNA repair exonuclease SbcCD ATPase subunit
MQQINLFPDVKHKRNVQLSNENLAAKNSSFNNSLLGLPNVKTNKMHGQKLFRSLKKPEEWLDNSPPEDIDVIYKSCEYQLNDILNKIENIELKFNINDKNIHHTLSRYAKQLNQVRDAASIYEIKSSRALRDVIAQTTTSIRAMTISEKQREKREKVILVEIESRPQSSAISDKIVPIQPPQPQKSISINEYNENLKLTKFILDKTIDVLSDKYPSIIQQVEQTLSIFEKYLLSFSNIGAFERLNSLRNSSELNTSSSFKTKKNNSAKSYLEAVYRYDSKCKDIAKFIRKLIKNLKSLAEKFDNPQSNGVSLSILAKEIQELALRCDGSSLPILFIVPEYNFQLKRCVESLKDWIKHDKSYKEFIHIDLKTVETSRNSLKHLLLDTQQAYNQIEYKTKLMRQELDKREIELENWYEKKEQDFLWEEEELQDRMLSKQLQKEVLENELVKMKRTPDLYMDFRCTTDRLTSDLKSIDNELPRLAKNINVCRNKIDYVKEKKKKHAELRSMVEKFDNETKKLSDQKQQYEIEFEKLDACYCILKEIYLYKKSSETLRKIYHNIPLKSLARRQFNSSSVLADISLNSSISNKNNEKIDGNFNHNTCNLPILII